jgi:uncharacterized protein YbjQ (UPF0145 family)
MTAKCLGCGLFDNNGDHVDGYCLSCTAEMAEHDEEELERIRVHQERFSQLDDLVPMVAISTTDHIIGRDIVEHVDLVRGGTVRAKHAGSDFVAGMKNIVGGEIKGYTELLSNAREEAIYRMKVDAIMKGADAVIGINFSTSMIDVGAAEITAFGTGVKLRETD